MAKCDVCGQSNVSCRWIQKNNFCESCFSELNEIRNGNVGMIMKYLNLKNMPYATESARLYFYEEAKDYYDKYKIDAQKIEEHEQAERKRKEIEASIVKREREFIVTTTPTIEGYYITRYLGIVSGEASIGTGFFSEIDASVSDFWGLEATGYSSKVGKSKAMAVNKMKKNALAMGATAVVGVDIDIMNTNANIFITCANGTAVITEKIEEDYYD